MEVADARAGQSRRTLSGGRGQRRQREEEEDFDLTVRPAVQKAHLRGGCGASKLEARGPRSRPRTCTPCIVQTTRRSSSRTVQNAHCSTFEEPELNGTLRVLPFSELSTMTSSPRE